LARTGNDWRKNNEEEFVARLLKPYFRFLAAAVFCAVFWCPRN
jgi:hypothetical protein